MKNEKEMLARHLSTNELMEVCEFVGGGEDPSIGLMSKLQNIFAEEMPYGTLKARDGDPYEWMSQKLTSILGEL